MSKRDSVLRVALLGNAAFSTLCAAVSTAAAETLAPHLGAPPLWLYALAAGLALFAVMLVWQATRTVMNPLDALLTSVADLGWVLGSAVLLWQWPGSFTDKGVMLVEGVAAFVLVCAVAQLIGLRRLIAETDPALETRCRIEVGVEVEASAEQMWAVISDMPGIHRYAPGLAASALREGSEPGLGVVRQCKSTKGERWAERCIGWEPERRLDLEFQTREEGFPFPMDPMVGGWRIDALGKGGSRVTVWWSFTTKPAWAELLIVPPMARSLQKSFPSVIETMAREAMGDGRDAAAPDYRQVAASQA